jgi:hypothetical protein
MPDFIYIGHKKIKVVSISRYCKTANTHIHIAQPVSSIYFRQKLIGSVEQILWIDPTISRLRYLIIVRSTYPVCYFESYSLSEIGVTGLMFASLLDQQTYHTPKAVKINWLKDGF